MATEAETENKPKAVGRLNKGAILKLVEEPNKKEQNMPKFDIGDTVEVHTRILEGEKERIQKFIGVVIARRGEGTREMFTVRRIVANEGVERTFPVLSPRIAKVVVKRSSVVRRAKLYFLRDRVGKATRLKERRVEVAKVEGEKKKTRLRGKARTRARKKAAEQS
ncbi:LSU ribosomal protein L19p [Planctomycetales bacterium 10988]|nr:LSU ribosomal protein L19p [Planctomycetales bacterium 10988]